MGFKAHPWGDGWTVSILHKPLKPHIQCVLPPNHKQVLPAIPPRHQRITRKVSSSMVSNAVGTWFFDKIDLQTKAVPDWKNVLICMLHNKIQETLHPLTRTSVYFVHSAEKTKIVSNTKWNTLVLKTKSLYFTFFDLFQCNCSAWMHWKKRWYVQPTRHYSNQFETETMRIICKYIQNNFRNNTQTCFCNGTGKRNMFFNKEKYLQFLAPRPQVLMSIGHKEAWRSTQLQ